MSDVIDFSAARALRAGRCPRCRSDDLRRDGHFRISGRRIGPARRCADCRWIGVEVTEEPLVLREARDGEAWEPYP